MATHNRRNRSRFTHAGLALAMTSALALSACGFGGGGDNAEGDGLNPGDYTVASADGVSDSVVVTGNIEPVRQVNITSALQSEVENVAVKAGDRVRAEQFLASLNTDQLERQLEIQQKQQANAQADAMAAVEQAQAQLDAYQASINNGTHPGIRAAQAQVNQAQAAYNAVAGASGGARVVSQGIAAVERAVGDASSAVRGGTQGTAGAPGRALTPPAPPVVPGAPGAAPGAAAVPGAPGANPAAGAGVNPNDIAAQLGGGGAGAGAGAGLSAEEAYAALQEARADLEVARTQAAQERDQLQAQVNSAWRQAEAAQLSESDGTLEYQVQESTIYAPISGLVTSVDVREGDIPQGKLLSIADDSRLMIRTDVREADVPNITEGDKVKFTSTATGKKEYTGRVVRIAPAAGTGGGAAAAQNPAMAMGGGGEGGSSTVTFPVEIEVTGDKEGLLLGGSVRAEIITAEAADAISVPVDAVYENEDGEKTVLVLATDSDDATSGKVEERSVKTGAANDVDIAVTGGDLKAGDIVINWPDEYQGRIGEHVDITDPNFDPAAVREAREKKQPTTATVTVTSTRRAAEAQ